MGWRWDGQRSSGRQFPFCWCVCVCVCGGEGGLVGHDKASNVALAAKSFTIICTIVKYSLPVSWYLLFLTKPPLHLVLNKAATIVLNRISSLHIVLFPHINICVVTKQMRDKTTRKVNTWPVTLKIYQVEGTVLVPIRIFVNKEVKKMKRMEHVQSCQLFLEYCACKIFDGDISFTSTSSSTSNKGPFPTLMQRGRLFLLWTTAFV